jgi:arylsulfatase
MNRTVVVFVSDHGEMNGDYNLIYKQNFLNAAVRVPCILRLPRPMRGHAGAVSPAVVELMDVGATVVDLAGGRPVEGSLARTLTSSLADPSTPHREVALSELRQEAMVANAHWKLAVNRDGDVYMLYDLENDPSETRNVAGDPDYAGTAEELLDCLRHRVSEGPQAPPEPRTRFGRRFRRADDSGND